MWCRTMTSNDARHDARSPDQQMEIEFQYAFDTYHLDFLKLVENKQTISLNRKTTLVAA